LFGCNASGPRRPNQPFAKQFAALFNFATLASFYRGQVERVHGQPDNEPGNEMRGFTQEQNVELTVAALKTAREADPTCFRIINSTGTWCDYYMGRRPAPWQQNVYDYLKMVKDSSNDYEAVGLQYYHSGRDMLEFERNLESFKGFGKPIHITELGFSSSSENAAKSEWWGGGVSPPRGAAMRHRRWHNIHFGSLRRHLPIPRLPAGLLEQSTVRRIESIDRCIVVGKRAHEL
jgi:hypothetical protein